MDKKFWAGYIVSSAVTALIQDVLGKKKYLQLAEEKWIEGKWLIPTELAAIAIGIYVSKKK